MSDIERIEKGIELAERLLSVVNGFKDMGLLDAVQCFIHTLSKQLDDWLKENEIRSPVDDALNKIEGS